MPVDVIEAIGLFPTCRLLVVGAAILDDYLEGSGSGISREGPVPVIDLHTRRPVPGGAANAAANVAALGAAVSFVTAIGADPEGDQLCNALERHGVPANNVIRCRERQTRVKHRLVADSHLIARFDQGTTSRLDADCERRLLETLAALWSTHDAVLVSDYGSGIITDPLLHALADLQRHSPRLLVADGRNPLRFATVGVTAIKPNFEETKRVVSLEPGGDRVQAVMRQAPRLVEALGAQLVAVTLDTDGSVFLEQDKPPYRTYAERKPNLKATGAGDTFSATLALALAVGSPTHLAAELASTAASLVAAEEGTTTCDRARLLAASSIDKRVSWTELPEIVAHHRREGRKIVFTNGCFDLLHRGHVTYLNRAKELGDTLIVGLNSDASVRRLKGRDRPFNNEDDRAQVLAALSSVDHVVVFDEDTASRLIEVIAPEVVVKGGDYTKEMLPEAQSVESYGGRIEILPYVEDRSTTAIIERLRNGTGQSAGSGAAK